MAARALLGLGLAVATVPAAARDYGQEGATFAILEPDLLAVIRQRLLRLEATGALDAANRALAARTVARVRRPAPVAGMKSATTSRRWLVDPSITAADDYRDARGRVVVARGTRVNPLDTVRLRQPLVFLDGDDRAQLAWAIARLPAAAKLILVRGAPLDLMKARRRRFYFDQGGALTSRLGIRAVPALVEQQGRLLAVREVALGSEGSPQ